MKLQGVLLPNKLAAELEATLEAPPAAWAEEVPILNCRSTSGSSSGRLKYGKGAVHKLC